MKTSQMLVVGVLLARPFLCSAQERPFAIEGLVVTASPTPRPAWEVARSVTVLQGSELRARGVTRVSDALRDVPGITVVEGGSFGATTSVFMRGGESDYVQVLVDGVPVNQPGGSFDFAGLALSGVERIEILRGPASSLYGSDAVAGVIQIITQAGEGGTSARGEVRGGSFGRREGSLAFTGGNEMAGWSLGLNHLVTNGILPFNNRHRNTSLSGSVRISPDSATRATVVLRVGDRRYGFPTDDTGLPVDRNAFTFLGETSVGVTVTRSVGTRVDLQGSLGLARNEGGTDDQPDSEADTLGFFGFTSLDRVQRATADLRANFRLAQGVATVGAEVEDQSQRSFSEAASEWGVMPGRSDDSRGNRAAYAHLVRTGRTFSYGIGGRLEDNERFGRFGSWNAEGAWHVGPTTKVFVSTGKALKEPTFYENFAAGYARGNPDLDPERSAAWELGAEHALAGDRGRVRVAWFSQLFRDLIQYTSAPPTADAPNFFNVGRARARGVEISADAHRGPAWLGVDWTWLDSRVTEGGDPSDTGADFLTGSRLLRRPSHAVNVHGAWALGHASLRADLRVTGAREDRDFSVYPAQRVTLARYSTLQVGLEVPVRSVVITARGENLLNAAYEEVQGYRAPGRGVYLGARVQLGG